MSDNVTHASHVESADNVTKAAHVDSVDHLVITAPPKSKQSKRVIALWLVVAALAFATQTMSMGLCVYFIASRNNDAADAAAQRTVLTRQIDDLSAQVSAAKAEQQAAVDTQRAKDDCQNAYARAITATNADELSALGALVVAGFSTPPAPNNDRTTLIAGALAQISATDAAYRSAVTARQKYIDAGSPLPCPIQGATS